MNKINVFVDTTAWFAGIDKNDQFHHLVMNQNGKYHRDHIRFITSNLVVHETTMLLERKISRREAIRFLSFVTADSSIEIVHADPDIEQESFSTYKKYFDQDYSIVDCISFTIMKQRAINRAFTFDSHFTNMGFMIEPHFTR